MSPEILAAIAGVLAALATLGVGKWVDKLIDLYGKRKGQEAKADESEQNELKRIHLQDRKRIDKLEERLDGKDKEIRSLIDQLSDAKITIGRQELRISDLEETSAGLRSELAECLSTHERRTP